MFWSCDKKRVIQLFSSWDQCGWNTQDDDWEGARVRCLLQPWVEQDRSSLHWGGGGQNNLSRHNLTYNINHTLSIWLVMEFTSDIFFKHQFALIIHKLFLKTNKININITKSLGVRSPWETSEHTTTFFGKMFYYFFLSHLWKIHLPSFQDLFHINLLVLSSSVIFHYNIF